MWGKKRAGATYEANCGCGKLYVTCNDIDDKFQEVFIKLGKAGGCSNAIMTSTGVLISQALKSGLSPTVIVNSLEGVGCHQSPNCLDAVAKIIREHTGV